MSAARRCSECPKSLAGKPSGTLTCGKSCRQKRARRLAKARAQEAHPLAPIRDAVNGAAEDVLHDVVAAELQPIVREAIGQEVLVAIDKLMALTPVLIETLGNDLRHEDPIVRGRAQTLLARYTLGHPAVMPKDEPAGGAKVEVHFNVPRPGSPDAPVPPAIEAEAVQLLVCQECAEEKPASEFLEASRRCRACDAKIRAAVAERFA